MKLRTFTRIRTLPVYMRLGIALLPLLLKVLTDPLAPGAHALIPGTVLSALLGGVLFPPVGAAVVSICAGLVWAFLNAPGSVDSEVLQWVWVAGALVRVAVTLPISWLVGWLIDTMQLFDIVGEYAQERILLLDSDGRAVFATRNAFSVHGRTHDQVIGRRVTEFMPEQHAALAQGLLEQVLRGKEVAWSSLAVLSRQGQRVPVAVTGIPATFRGQPHAVALFRDVAGGELTDKVYLGGLDALDSAISIRSPDGRIIWCNAEFARTVGRDRSELIGEFVWAYNHQPPDDPAIRRTWLDGSRPEWESEAPGGRSIAGTVRPILGENGEWVASITLIKDLTEYKRNAARFIKAEQMATVGQMATGVAHNLNNVLSAICLQAQLLELQPEQGVAVAGKIREAVEHGTRLVRSLYALAGTGAPSSPGPVSVAEAVSGVLRLAEVQIERQGIDVSLQVPEEATVWADATMLRQVLTNLVLNAVQAMPGGGKLRIRTERLAGGRAAIHVSDTGCGIAEADRAKIFTPFFSTKGASGTGLGLSTSLTMVRSMDGELELRTVPGDGCTFTVTLPEPPDMKAS